MIYKVKKYYPHGVDRRKLLEEGYARGRSIGTNAEAYKNQDFWPLLQGRLKQDGHYLDAGCGVGGWLLFLNEEGYRVEGVDEAAKVLRSMTEYNRDLRVKQGRLTALPYADNSFDGVLAIGSLDHEEDDLDAAVKEMRRVLKHDGLLFLEVPLLNSLRRWKYVPLKRLEALVRRALGHREVFAGYMFDRSAIKDLLKKHGFTVHEVKPHDLQKSGEHYGLYVDWKWLRGSRPYQLNFLGKIAKALWNAISPWVASTGMVVVARKVKN